jgi:hypothetical protein
MELSEEALTAAHKAVEDVLVELRDQQISVLDRGNGFVIRDPDGQPSSIMRLSARDGLRIGIAAYLSRLDDLSVDLIDAWPEEAPP